MKIILFFLFCAITLDAQKTSKGVITRVIDIDSYIVDVESYKGFEATLRVRIVNADGPEIEFKAKRKPAQEYGHKGKAIVAGLIEGKEVELVYYGKDYWNRVLAFISINGERLDYLLLDRGLAWYDSQYHEKKKCKVCAEKEAKAREQRIGLWNYTDPIRPSIYRKN